MSILAKSGSDICKANTNTSTAKFQFSFSKASRFPEPNLAEKIRTKKLQEKLDKGESLPVPIRESHYQFYNLPSTQSTRRTTFGKGNKYDFTKSGNYCKESYYNPKSDFDKDHPHGPKFSFPMADRSGKGRVQKPGEEKKEEKKEEPTEGDKKKEEVDIDGPSPARYNILKPFGWDAPKVSIKGRHINSAKKKKNEEEAEKKEEEKPYLTKVTIQIRNTGKYVVSQIPNVNSIKLDKDKSKRTQFDANKNPGPSDYHIPPLICNKVSESQYRNYENIKISGRYKIKDSRSNYPGPGSYVIPSDFGIYESKDKDKYPQENVYVEPKPKYEDKPWRHGMKIIKPKEEEENEQNNDYNEDQGNQEDNEGGSPEEKAEETPKEDENKEDEKKGDENKEEEKKEEAPKEEEKKEEKEEDKESEVIMLRDMLTYREGEEGAES